MQAPIRRLTAGQAALAIVCALLATAAPASAGRPRAIGFTDLSRPRGISFSDGTLWVADTGNDRVLRVGDGISTIASGAGLGTTAAPSSCGSQNATFTALCLPAGVAPVPAGGPQGEFFVADSWDFRVLRVDPSRGSATVAGTPGVFDSNGDPGDGGPATRAQLGVPWSIAFDTARGHYYISERDGLRIRRVDYLDPNQTITTLAGGGSLPPADGVAARDVRLLAPTGMALDVAADELYVADEGWHVVLKIDLSSTPPKVFVVAGTVGQPGSTGEGVPATAALFRAPRGVAIRGCSLLVADTGNNRIRRIDRCDPQSVVTTFAGTGSPGFFGEDVPATSANLDAPSGVAAGDDGDVWIADTENCRVRVVDAAGLISTYMGEGCPPDPSPGALHIAEPSPGVGSAFAMSPLPDLDTTREYVVRFSLLVPQARATYRNRSHQPITDLDPEHFFWVWEDSSVSLMLNTHCYDAPTNADCRPYQLVYYVRGQDRFIPVADLSQRLDRWIPIRIVVQPETLTFTVFVNGVVKPPLTMTGIGALRRTLFGDARWGCTTLDCVNSNLRGDDSVFTNHGEAFWDDVSIEQKGEVVLRESFDGPRCLRGWDVVADPATSIVQCTAP